MRASALFFIVQICACAIFVPSAAAQQPPRKSTDLAKIKEATTVAIDCSACPRSLANARKAAHQALDTWKRFRVVEDPKEADLVFMFSGNPYLGDYITRDGPDQRPVRILSTIMTVIDPHTGKELWSDSRQWGSLRVGGATNSLIDELRGDLEAESTKWTVDDVLRCSDSPAFRPFAFLTPEAALAIPELGVSKIADASDHLKANVRNAPKFCSRAQLIVGRDKKIDGYEVVASPSDVLDVADVLERADRFQFASGKDPRNNAVTFTARSLDGKVVIQFEVQGHRTVLSRVEYSY
jgi:hypothetical protein